VKFLVDANMSPRVAEFLRSNGHDAVAVRDIGLAEASDDEILDCAAVDDRIVISHDTDFGALLAFRRLSKPSFILIRSSDPMTPDDHTSLILANLDAINDDLAAGAIVVFANARTPQGARVKPSARSPTSHDGAARRPTRRRGNRGPTALARRSSSPVLP
jgi:predicted nuclease of predicted toxin-antitoxin system